MTAARPDEKPPKPGRRAPDSKPPTGSSRTSVFFIQIVYLLALGAFVIAYRVDWIDPRRDFFGPVPFLVPWFGAVGATLLSLIEDAIGTPNFASGIGRVHLSAGLSRP
jgi:hypothetical protein